MCRVFFIPLSIVLLLCLCPVMGMAQGWYKIYQEAEELMRNGESDEAIRIAEQSLVRFLQEDGTNSPNHAAILRFITTASFSMGYFDKSVEYGSREIRVHKEIENADPEMKGSAHFNLGYAHYMLDQFEEAASHFQAAIDQLEKNIDLKTNALWLMGSTMYQLNEIQEASDYLNRGFAAFGEREEITMDYLTATFNMGMVQMDFENYPKALGWFKETESIYEAAGLESSSEYALVLEQIGICHQEANDYSQALEKYNEAIEIYSDNDMPVSSGLINRKATCLQQLGRGDEATQLLTNQVGSNPATLINLAALKQGEGKFAEAQNYYARAFEIVSEEDPIFIEISENLGIMLLETGTIEEAGNHLRKALALSESKYGLTSTRYASSLQKNALLKSREGNHKESEALYRKALDILEKNLMPGDTRMATCHEGLATVLQAMGKFPESEQYYNLALEAYRNTDNPPILEFSNLLNNFATLNEQNGRYTQARELLDEALDYAKTRNNTALTLKISENFGTLLLKMGILTNAENIFNETLKISEATGGKSSQGYARNLLNIARIYQARGQYQEAEPMLSEALSLLRNTEGKKSSQYAEGLNTQALFYQTLGNYKVAEPLFEEAKGIFEINGQTQTITYASILENMATLYQIQGQDQKALPLLITASEIDKAVLGANHPLYATTLHNMASIYQKSGELKKAEALFNEGLVIYEATFGKEHPSYASTLYNLAVLNQDMEQYQKAENYFKEALKIRKKALGTDHPEYIYSEYGLAALYFGTGAFEKAAPLYRNVISNYQKKVNDLFPSMSEREKTAFYTKIRPVFESFQDFAIEYHLKSKGASSILGELYDLQLSTKALLLNASNKVRQRILSSNDEVLIMLYDEWINVKEEIVRYYSFGSQIEQLNPEQIKYLEFKANEVEKVLSEKSEIFATEIDRQQYSWKDLRNTLGQNEAAVEIMRVKKRFNPDSVMYLALYVTSESEQAPGLVIFDKGTQLEAKFYKYYINTTYFKIENLYSYGNYFEKLNLALKDKLTVFISLDGIFNKINLNSLRNPVKGTFVLDEKDIRLVSNTREIIEKRNPVKAGARKTGHFFGFPEYVSGSANKITQNGGPVMRSAFREIIGNYIPELPGTMEEIRALTTLLSAQNWEIFKYLESLASEENIKKVNNPYLLHVATHGFFMDDLEIEESPANNQVEMINPLFRSGLLLAGAGDQVVSVSTGAVREDGVLTAYEAMNLSLDETEMVILSACETALGEVKTGEGVYGLQRAFLVAGARSIIMSLWKVDDAVTQLLMKEFYNTWISSGDKFGAFKAAQVKIKESYPDPYYWGAFVLTGH